MQVNGHLGQEPPFVIRDIAQIGIGDRHNMQRVLRT